MIVVLIICVVIRNKLCQETLQIKEMSFHSLHLFPLQKRRNMRVCHFLEHSSSLGFEIELIGLMTDSNRKRSRSATISISRPNYHDPIPTFQESQSPSALHLPSSVVRINSDSKTVDVEQLSGEQPERIALAFGTALDMEGFSQVCSTRAI